MNSGKEHRSDRSQLGNRDRLILDDVIRYRLLTNDWIHQKYLGTANLNAVVKISGRLTREGWLAQHKLYRKKYYFTSGPKLVRLRGLPQARLRPLGPQSLASYYAALRYCGVKDSKTGVTFELATAEEVKAALPWLPERVEHRLHILAQSDGRVDWRILRIDLGGRVDHIARKIKTDIFRITQNNVGQDMVSQGQFTQVILCATPAKKRQVEQCLAERVWPKGIKFQIGVIPDLFQLLAIT